MSIKFDILKNFKEFITELVEDCYYGEVNISFSEGIITLGRKSDKIKFDNDSYKLYKSNNI